MDQIERL